MKHARNLSIIAIIFFMVAYLLGAFYACSLDLSRWTTETRGNVIGFYLMATALAAMVYGMTQMDKS